MAYSFPNTPAEGDIYTPATGASYTFTEGCWRRSGVSSGYVLKAGDVMTGALVLPDPNPNQPLHAAHKKYVDETVARESLWQSVWAVATNQPDITPSVVNPLHGYSWTAVTVDPAVPEIAPAGLPGIEGKSIGSNDTVVWNENALQYEHVPIPLGASAMLVQDVPPAGAFHGQVWFDSDSGKQYVWYDDSTSQAWVQISGGGGASKAEVYFGDVAPDPTFDGELWWDTTTGNLMLNYNGAWVQTNVEEAPVDGAQYTRSNAGWGISTTTGLTEAPVNGQAYVRRSGLWSVIQKADIRDLEDGFTQAEADARYLKLTGGAVSGPLEMTDQGIHFSAGVVGGIHWWDSNVVTDPEDLRGSIIFYNNYSSQKIQRGFSVTADALNYVVKGDAARHAFYAGGVSVMNVWSDGVHIPTGYLNVGGVLTVAGDTALNGKATFKGKATFNGEAAFNGDITANTATFSADVVTGNCYVSGVFTSHGELWADNNIHIQDPGRIFAGIGINTRAGSGEYGGNFFNFFWDGLLHGYVDGTHLGTVNFSSDYLIGENLQLGRRSLSLSRRVHPAGRSRTMRRFWQAVHSQRRH